MKTKEKENKNEDLKVQTETFTHHGITFTLGKVDEKILIAWGPNIVSYKKFDTFMQAKKYIMQKPYEIILGLCACIVEQSKNNNL